LFTPLDEADVDATAPDDALLVVNISLFFCLKREREREREISNYEERERQSSLQRERDGEEKRAKKEQKPNEKTNPPAKTRD
jgi:hypothetical protein